MGSKESSSMSSLETDMWKLRKEMENLQAEVEAIIGELRESLHVLQNLNYPESPFSARFDLLRERRKKLN
jgi:hypothetical protein